MSTSVPCLAPSLPAHGTPRRLRPEAAVHRIPSGQLLPDGARELVIQHRGGEYHLRLTRNDKLILTK
jgi:hemin uptake protein HemP